MTVGVAIVAVAIVAVWTLRLRASGRHFAFLTMATAFALAGVALVTVSLLEAALGFDDLRAIERLLGKLEEGVYFAGTSGRQELHAAAIDGWSRSPVFGIGIGGYPSLLTNLPRDYPHNIVLEILCELGVVGLALFLWGVRAVWGHFRTALRLRTFAADIAVFTSVLYALSALASGSLNDHRILFLHVGVVIGLSYAAGRAAEQAETAAPAAPSPAPPPVAAGGA
ncbi:MAG: O-antigen ligase family protein [Rhodospirillales bacterium]|nr:MAG: O-antigen ligase family protein [Rhodospirillales bacterium]